MSYSWSPHYEGRCGSLLNPLPKCEFLDVCQHEERFEFYLKWQDESGKSRFSEVNGWEIRHIYFETLDEAVDCLSYIFRQFRRNYKAPENSIEFMKGVPIKFNGTADVGDPIAYTYDGKPCEWEKPPIVTPAPKRGRVSDQDLGR